MVAFTAASGAVAGGWAQLTLVADGTNTPIVSRRMERWRGSNPGPARPASCISTVWYDGFFYWYSIAPGPRPSMA